MENTWRMRHHKGLGIVVIAIGIVAIGAAFYGLYQRTTINSSPTVEIRITAKQFRYDPVVIRGHEGVEATSLPSTGQFANTTISVMKWDRIILRLISLDIPHGFGIYEYDIFVNIPVGETVTAEFVANKSGRFTFYCTVFCGTGHPNHVGTLIVKGG